MKTIILLLLLVPPTLFAQSVGMYGSLSYHYNTLEKASSLSNFKHSKNALHSVTAALGVNINSLVIGLGSGAYTDETNRVIPVFAEVGLLKQKLPMFLLRGGAAIHYGDVGLYLNTRFGFACKVADVISIAPYVSFTHMKFPDKRVDNLDARVFRYRINNWQAVAIGLQIALHN